ncbi:MAG: hypothetical protein M3040_06525, partial [Bacteroidota bacterium]|nr:hypothetical protein [Bacteroidota bacterium]
STLQRPDLKPLIVTSLFTQQKYQLIYNVHWLVYPVITAVSFVSYIYAAPIYNTLLLISGYLKTSFSHVIVSFKNLPSKEKLVLVILCCTYCGVVLYNDHLKQITYDEAWGYNYYINKPFYFPVILFNTYPLFNVVCHLFILLPFDTLLDLRLPPLLFGLFTLLTLFYILYKSTGFVLSAFALVLLAASPLVYIYSSLSRGITLSLFLAVVVLHIVIHATTYKDFNRRYRFLYIVANVLGIISMPTFLLYTVGNTLFLMVSNKNNTVVLRSIITSVVIVFVVALTFYLPVILNTGLSLIYHNNHYSFNIVDTIDKVSSFVFGLSALFFVSKYIALPLLFIALILIFKRRLPAFEKTTVKLSMFIILFSILMRAATGNIFPERSLNYLILSFILICIALLSFLFNYYSKGVKLAILLPLLLVGGCAFVYNQKQLLLAVEDEEAKTIATLFLGNEVKTVYIDNEEFWLRVPMVEYYYSKEHKQIIFGTSEKNSTRYRPFSFDNNDDCIVTGNSSSYDRVSGYKIIYTNKSFIIWTRRLKTGRMRNAKFDAAS